MTIFIFHRLDAFYDAFFKHKPEFSNLWKVAKIILALSHGQAQVERGFSINKDISTTNMRLQTLVAKRRVDDHLNHCGGIDGLVITSTLRTSCLTSHRR